MVGAQLAEDFGGACTAAKTAADRAWKGAREKLRADVSAASEACVQRVHAAVADVTKQRSGVVSSLQHLLKASLQHYNA